MCLASTSVDDGVERDLFEHGIVEEEGLGDRHRIGESAGLDQDVVDTADELAHDVEQVGADRRDAADAAVAHLDDLLVGGHHEVRIDVDLAELVLDHGDAAAVLLAEDVVEQRGLARAQEAGEDRDADLRRAHAPFSVSSRRRGQAHRVEDLLVARASAEVAGQCLPDRRLLGRRLPPQQLVDGDDQPWRAEPALHRAGVEERLLHGVKVITLRQPLDGDDRRAVRLPRSHEARAHQDIVHQDRARSALALLAGVLRAPQLEALAQDVEQALAPPDVVDLAVATVDRHAEPHR